MVSSAAQTRAARLADLHKGDRKELGPTTLPPGVDGVQRGELQLRLDNLRWDLPGAPSNVQARVRWWGEALDAPGSVIKLRPSPGGRDGHLLRFRINCGPKPMRRYLKDMATMVISVEDSRNSIQKGTVSIDIRMLDPQTPLSGCYPVVGQNRRALGRIDIRMSMAFDAAVVSSFEMNEYLAATDATLPVYPTPGRRPKEPVPAASDEDGALKVFKDSATTARQDLFALLFNVPNGHGMKQKLKHLEELFDLLNKTRGQDTLGLSAEGLRRLLERLLSGIAAEGEQRHALVKYLMAIFEPAEGGELTLERLQNIYRDACSLQGLFTGPGDVKVLDILRRLAEEAGQRRMELKAAFREDGALDGAAALDVGPLLLLLRRLFPWISRREEWCLLGLLYKVDVNETGKISFGGLAELMRGLLQLDAQPAGEGNKENFRAPPEFSWSNLRIGTSHTASSHLSVSPGNKKEQVLTRAVPKAGATVHESLPPTEQPQRGALGMTLMPSSPLDQMQADITANGTEVIESNDPLAVLIGRAERLRSAMNDALKPSSMLNPFKDPRLAYLPASPPTGAETQQHWGSGNSIGGIQGFDGNETLANWAAYRPVPTAMSDSEQQLWGFSAPPSPDDDSGVQGEIDDLLLEELFLKPSHDPSGDGKVEPQSQVESETLQTVGSSADALHLHGEEPALAQQVPDELRPFAPAKGGPLRISLRLLGALARGTAGMQVVIKTKCGVASTIGFALSNLLKPVDVEVHPSAEVADCKFVFELWKDIGDFSSRDPRQLVGIAKLDVRESLGQIEGGGSSAVLLHDCAVDVRDIFKGSMAGQLLISIRKGVEIHDGLVESQEDAKGRGSPGPGPEGAERMSRHHPDSAAKHTFDVTVVSGSGMPPALDVDMEMGFAPEARYVAYRFPGEEDVLYTREVPPDADVSYGANACHTISLRYSESLEDHLQAFAEPEFPSEPTLVFEVWNKWPSGEVSQVGEARLPLVQLLRNAASNEVEYRLPVELEGDTAEARLALESPTLLVRVNYRVEVDPVPANPDYQSGESPQPGGADYLAKLHTAQEALVEESSPAMARVCVEILRAAGLKRAVREASVWLGGGTGSLGRAIQVGPHSYARMSLFPADPELELSVPPLRTPFQAQTFTPNYSFKREFDARLDMRFVHALATQEMGLEIWHHCPRTQALKVALGSPGAERLGSKPQDVFLGAACASLLPLLTTPQGLRSWLPLKSRRGELVGAVEVAVYFSQIGGNLPNIACHCPLERFPELGKLMPTTFDSRNFTPSGFDGQMARATVYIDEAVLPPSEAGKLDRGALAPKYFAAYRLPGSQSTETTPAVAALDDGQRGRLAQLGYCGIHWVRANSSLVHALRGSPMEVQVHRQDSSRTGASPAPVMLGAAQIDLQQLIVETSRRTPKGNEDQQRPGARLVIGTFHLVNPESRDLGCARIRAKVLLEMSPVGDTDSPAMRLRWDVHGSGFNMDIEGFSPGPRRLKVEAAPIHLGEEASLSQDQHTITSENQKEHKEADSKLAGAEVGNWSGPQEDLVDVKGGTPSAGQGSMDVVEPSFAELLPTKSSVIDRPSEGPSCEQLSNSEGKDDSSEDLIPLRLCVQRAANLRLPGSSGSQAGREAAFCVLEWPVDRKVVETPMVPVVGAGADWFHTTYVPAWRQRPVARRREELTSAIIRVYTRPQTGGQLFRSAQVSQAIPTEQHLLGTAALDFSLLWLGLDQVEGWYNILDSRHQVVGQLKVSLTPPTRLYRALEHQSPPSSDFQQPQQRETLVPEEDSIRPRQQDEAANQVREEDATESNFTQAGLARSYMQTPPSASDQELARDLQSRLQELDELASKLTARLSSWSEPSHAGTPCSSEGDPVPGRRDDQGGETDPRGHPTSPIIENRTGQEVSRPRPHQGLPTSGSPKPLETCNEQPMSSPFRSPRKIGSVPCREGSVPSWDEPLFQSPKQSPGTSERAFKEREEHALDGTSGSRPSDAGSTKGSQRLSGVGGIDSPLSPGPSTASAPKEQEGDDAACSAEASRSPSPRPPCADGPKDSKKAPQGRVVDTGSQWGSQTSASQGADGGSLQGSPKELIYGASPDGCTGAPTPPPINEGAALLGTEGFQGGQDLLKGPGPQGTSRMDQDQARHVSIQVTGHREDTARGTVPCAVGEGERSLSGPLLSPSRPPADEMEGQAEGDALMSSSGPSPSDSSNDSGKDEIGSAPLDFHAERGTETLEPPSELNNLSREADGCEGGMAARHVSTVPTEGQKSNCAEGSEDHEGVLPPLPPHAESRDNAGTTSPGTSEHRPPLRDHQRTPDAPEEEEEGLEGSPGAWGASTGPVDSLSATNSAEAQKGSHADSDSIGKPQSQSPPVLAQPGPVERARGEQSEPAGGRPPARQLPPELGISRHLLPEPRGASLSNTSVVGQKYNVEGTAQVRSPTQGGWTGGTWRVSSQVTFTALPQRYQYSFQTEEGDGKVQTRGKVPPPSSCSSSPPMHRPTPAALLPPQPLPLSRERETGNGSAGRQNRSRRYSDKETARIARIMGRPP